jgi:quinol monooxygenase YgiN
MSVKVVADNWVREDAADGFIAAAQELVRLSHEKDAGCLAYDLYRDTADPLHLTVIEEWASQDALRAHMASEHFQRLIPVFGTSAQADKPGVISVYEPV